MQDFESRLFHNSIQIEVRQIRSRQICQFHPERIGKQSSVGICIHVEFNLLQTHLSQLANQWRMAVIPRLGCFFRQLGHGRKHLRGRGEMIRIVAADRLELIQSRLIARQTGVDCQHPTSYDPRGGLHHSDGRFGHHSDWVGSGVGEFSGAARREPPQRHPLAGCCHPRRGAWGRYRFRG